MQNKKNSKILTAILFALIGLSGCSTYPNKFKCGDAKGLGCTMLRDVDNQIDSGQIEEAYKKSKKCRGRSCSAKVPSSDQSLLKPAPKSKAQTYDIEEVNDIIDKENNLYF
jgi:hypothetical protein